MIKYVTRDISRNTSDLPHGRKPRTRKAALERAQRAAELHDTIRNPMKTAAWREYREAHAPRVEM